jgi:hypothetical protein
VAHDARLESAPGLAQLFPVGHLLDHDGPLLADGPGGLAEVAPKLGVVEALPGGFFE